MNTVVLLVLLRLKILLKKSLVIFATNSTQMNFQKFKKLDENHYIIDAKMLIENVNDFLGINIDEEDIDTIGGWFMTKSFDAVKGEKIVEQGYDFMIKDIDGHHIQYLEIVKATPINNELEEITEEQ